MFTSRPSVARAATVVAVAASIVMGAGCERPGRTVPNSANAPSPTPRPPGADCPAESTKGKQVRFAGAPGNELAGITVGDGSTGIILVHGVNRDLCTWLPYGLLLANAGYRVLAFDFPGHGASTATPDTGRDRAIGAAVAHLRGSGVTKTVVIGIDIGATAAIVAATQITPPVDGLLCLAIRETDGTLNAAAAAPELLVPTEFFVASEDANRDDTIKVSNAMPRRGVYHGYRIVDGEFKGVDLVNAPVKFGYSRGDTVRKMMETFIGETAAGKWS